MNVAAVWLDADSACGCNRKPPGGMMNLRVRAKDGKQLKLSFKHNKVVDGKKPQQSVSVQLVTLFPRER
jgi:hypothetical protein